MSQLTLRPCALVPADQAAGAQVVQLHVQSAGPLPDALQAAAAAAGWPLSVALCFNLAFQVVPQSTFGLTIPSISLL